MDEVNDHTIMTVPEAAEFLRISESTIRDLVAQQRVPFFRIGSRILFYRIRLEEWVDSLTIEPVPYTLKEETANKALTIWNSTNRS